MIFYHQFDTMPNIKNLARVLAENLFDSISACDENLKATKLNTGVSLV
jgi:hypothetical protein